MKGDFLDLKIAELSKLSTDEKREVLAKLVAQVKDAFLFSRKNCGF